MKDIKWSYRLKIFRKGSDVVRKYDFYSFFGMIRFICFILKKEQVTKIEVVKLDV